MNEISKYIENKITSIGNPDKAKWLENYVKHDIKSNRVGIPEIRQIVKEANRNNRLTERDISEQIEILNDLMSRDYTEDKLSAILYIQLFWSGKNENETIALISDWFDKEWISDWNICDWLCVRLLTPLIDNWTKQTIIELKKWNKDKNQWKARASLVPFAQCKKIDEHKDIVYEFSIELIKRKERFCKTSVGWVLREYSKIDRDFVTAFLTKYNKWATKEVVKNATKYMRAHKFADTAAREA